MAYPVFYPFKTRMYQATTSSTSFTLNVVVAARGQYKGSVVSQNSSSVLTGVFDILLNGIGVVGSSNTSVTSSTAPNSGGGVIVPAPTVATYVSPGDVIGTLCSTALGGFSVTHVIQEF